MYRKVDGQKPDCNGREDVLVKRWGEAKGHSLYVCMYTYVSMYVCIYVCVCLCMYFGCIRTYVCLYVRMYVCMYVCVYILYVCMHACMYACSINITYMKHSENIANIFIPCSENTVIHTCIHT
jgi:hypothetical protein